MLVTALDLILFVGNVMTTPTGFQAEALALNNMATSPKRSNPAVAWSKTGLTCDPTAANACITRGGDPTGNDFFHDANACQSATVTYASKIEKGIDDAGNTGHCTITVKTDNSCCINRLCSDQEFSLDRQIAKTTDAFHPDTVGDVGFSVGCPKGAYIQSEIRIW